MMILSTCRCYPKQSVSIYNYVKVLHTSKQPNICVPLLTEVQFCVVLLKTFLVYTWPRFSRTSFTYPGCFHLFTSFGFLSLGIANSAHLHLRLYIFSFCWSFPLACPVVPSSQPCCVVYCWSSEFQSGSTVEKVCAKIQQVVQKSIFSSF